MKRASAGTKRTRQVSFVKSAYGSRSGVQMVVRHRFSYAAFDSPDEQILMNVASRNRLIVRKIACA